MTAKEREFRLEGKQAHVSRRTTDIKPQSTVNVLALCYVIFLSYINNFNVQNNMNPAARKRVRLLQPIGCVMLSKTNPLPGGSSYKK